MKRFMVFCIFLFLIIWGFFVFREKDKSIERVKVGEVTHSVFYAPMYLADKLGFFRDNGIDVSFVLASGADKVTAAVLSGDVNIGFCGSEATIYLFNNGEKDYLVNFAGLTKRDGSFIVSREKLSNFSIDDLNGKKILGGRKMGMPSMTLNYALSKNGVKDINIDTSIDFAAMSGSFISGNGDFVTLFEPNASSLEKKGYGYIVSSVGSLGGVVPYTSFNARKSYIRKKPDVIKGFRASIQSGLDYVHTHSSSEVAGLISSYFPDTSKGDLTLIIQRYMDIDAWQDNINISKRDFEHLEEIMRFNGDLKRNVPYSKLIYVE